jgi:hypothetical protein
MQMIFPAIEGFGREIMDVFRWGFSIKAIQASRALLK